MSLFLDSGVGLILSIVCSSPAIYNREANDVGPVRMHVQARSFTNRLHGKAAERSVLSEITVVKLKSPSSTFTVK